MSEATSTVAELVKTFLLDAVGVKPELLDNPSLKLEDLGVDSLSAAEMLFEVEDKFGVNIEDVSALKSMTVSQVCFHFQQLVDARQIRIGIDGAADAPLGVAA